MSSHTSRSRRPIALIVGFGQMGHAMQVLLNKQAHICIWHVTPQNQQPPRSVRTAAGRAEFILLCVPTVAIALLMNNLQTFINRHAVLISVAKGLDEHGHTASDILKLQAGKTTRWGVLGGPMIANELRTGQYGFAELGSYSRVTQQRISGLFRGTSLHLTPNLNPNAVSWCGVLKNVYVPVLGLADGLGWGDNLRGKLICAALAEMTRLVAKLCGARRAADGSAGLADLATTATSRSSHHRALGRRIAQGNFGKPHGEGPHSVYIMQRAKMLPAVRAFPLLHVAITLVQHPVTARSQLAKWIAKTA